MNDSIELTLWKNANAIQGKAESLPWATLPDVIREAAGQPNKESCPMIKLATFGSQRTAKGSLRHDENIRSITGIDGTNNNVARNTTAFTIAKKAIAVVREKAAARKLLTIFRCVSITPFAFPVVPDV